MQVELLRSRRKHKEFPMSMLLHRHLVGATKPPVKVDENKLEKEFENVKKEKANDYRRKNNNSKNISK